MTTRFLNKNVYFQTVLSEFTEGMASTPSVSNMRDFVFTVTPKLKFEFHRDYKEALKELKGLNQSYKLLNNDEKKDKKKLLE